MSADDRCPHGRTIDEACDGCRLESALADAKDALAAFERAGGNLDDLPSGDLIVLLRRLDGLELEIRRAPVYPARADLEFAFDQVLSSAKRLAGTRNRAVDAVRERRTYTVQHGDEQQHEDDVATGLDYDAMRARVYELGLERWTAAGQPLDTAWPAATADELAWQVDERDPYLRTIALPDGTTIYVRATSELKAPAS